MTDHVNGVALLLNELNDGLDGKRKLTRRELDYLQLRATKYLLEAIPPIRESQARLEKHDVIQWGVIHPRAAFIIVVSTLILNASVNWSGIRKPIMQVAWHYMTGITLPLDSFP